MTTFPFEDVRDYDLAIYYASLEDEVNMEEFLRWHGPLDWE